MATQAEQLAALGTRLDNYGAMLQASRLPGQMYALIGECVVFGCKVTQGYSGTDMVLALDGQASGDSAHLNPDGYSPPARPEQYWNSAIVYGEPFFSDDRNVATLQDSAFIVATAPGTGYHRYDIAYIYVGQAGPALGIAAGTAVVNASTPDDPTLPHGALALARIHVEANVTGIANSKITDLRDFSGRLSGTGITEDAVGFHLTGGTTPKTLTVTDSATIATNSITFAGTEVLTLAPAKNVSFADAFSTIGAFALTFTVTGATALTLPTSGTLATQAYADALVVGLLDDRGSYNASGNTFPASGGSGTAGAILKGDLWYISVAGTLGGTAVNIGDSVRAMTDTPGQTAGNWSVLESNIGFVPENVANKDATGGYAGLTLFKLNLRNAANTYTSYLTNSATASRTWTMPNQDGTVAMTSDITGGTLAGAFTTLSATSDVTITTGNLSVSNAVPRIAIKRTNDAADSGIDYRVSDGSRKFFEGLLDGTNNWRVYNDAAGLNALTITDSTMDVALGSTTDATSTTAASLKTAGGIAAVKAIYGGTTLNIAGVDITPAQGTWTPAQHSFTLVGSPTYAGTYTKIGRLVYLRGSMTPGTSWASTATVSYIDGLPFTPAVTASIALSDSGGGGYASGLITTSGRIFFPTIGTTTTTVIFSACYEV